MEEDLSLFTRFFLFGWSFLLLSVFMSNARYHFTTRWTLDAGCEEIYHILEKATDLPRWWPSVYLEVLELEQGAPDGVGKYIALHTKGWLPYTLRWNFRVTAAHFPTGYTLEADGDFEGRGVWTFRPLPDGRCEAVYDWQISARKPLLKYLTFLLRPLFSANHRWAMRQGEESLRKELLRRRHHAAPRRDSASELVTA